MNKGLKKPPPKVHEHTAVKSNCSLIRTSVSFATVKSVESLGGQISGQASTNRTPAVSKDAGDRCVHSSTHWCPPRRAHRLSLAAKRFD